MTTVSSAYLKTIMIINRKCLDGHCQLIRQSCIFRVYGDIGVNFFSINTVQYNATKRVAVVYDYDYFMGVAKCVSAFRRCNFVRKAASRDFVSVRCPEQRGTEVVASQRLILYQIHAKMNRCFSACLFERSCPPLGGSIKRGSTLSPIHQTEATTYLAEGVADFLHENTPGARKGETTEKPLPPQLPLPSSP